MGFDELITIQFIDERRLPFARTCILQLQLSTVYCSFDEFDKDMRIAISEKGFLLCLQPSYILTHTFISVLFHTPISVTFHTLILLPHFSNILYPHIIFSVCIYKCLKFFRLNKYYELL